MGLGRTAAVALVGLEGALVEVEADISPGLPVFLIGGLPDAACRQSADRIKAAAANRSRSTCHRRGCPRRVRLSIWLLPSRCWLPLENFPARWSKTSSTLGS